jgi:hypothetical protein
MPATAEQKLGQAIFGEDDDAPPADPFMIEPLLLPSGAKVAFRSMAKLTADNVRWLRGVDDREGNMIMYNEVNRRAMVLLIDSWNLTAPSGRPIPIPREDRQNNWLKQVGAFDFTAIERHLREPVQRLVGDDLGPAEGE